MTATAVTPSAPTRTRTEPDVLLVVPPFQGLRCPALGASQLKGNLLQAGIPSELLYLNLRFAERISPRVHEWLSGTGPTLLGEYVFSHVAHEFDDAHLERYVREVVQDSDLATMLRRWYPDKDTITALKHLIEQARQFVRGEAVEEILRRNPKIVGFSSTFQANCCSIAVIRELKKRRPDIVTLVGGANCEGVMGEELLARYPEIDYVGRGECDKTLPVFVRTVLEGGKVQKLTGFLSRGDSAPACPSPPLHGGDLDANAHPDFDDYFGQLETSSFREQIEPGLAMETSRGCWWGMKQHCTFCAFNREGMIFRSKSHERVMGEIDALMGRYGLSRMEMTDNILDMAYFKNLLKDLAATPKVEMFWETKSNLSREQVRLMRQAGINWIQPGIESLSDLSLKLMRKGATQLQQVQLLKYATESGVRITWNWLFGFPGEDEDEMKALARAVDAVHHLQPPSSSPVLYLERFSPYFEAPEQWGIQPIHPSKAYAHVYPYEQESLNRLAFFFESDYMAKKGQSTAHAELERIVQRWNDAYPKSHFIAAPRRGALLLLDTRPCAKKRVRRLTGLERRVFEFCWKIRGKRDIQRQFAGEASPEQIDALLQRFVDDYLMLQSKEGDRFLVLATDPRHGYKAFPAVFPGGGLRRVAQGPRGLRRFVARPRVLAARLRAAALARTVQLFTKLAGPTGELGDGVDASGPDASAETGDRVVA